MAASRGKKRNADLTESQKTSFSKSRNKNFGIFFLISKYIFMHFHMEIYGLLCAVTENY